MKEDGDLPGSVMGPEEKMTAFRVLTARDKFYLVVHGVAEENRAWLPPLSTPLLLIMLRLYDLSLALHRHRRGCGW